MSGCWREGRMDHAPVDSGFQRQPDATCSRGCPHGIAVNLTETGKALASFPWVAAMTSD